MDMIYIINLKHREDRRNKMLKEIERVIKGTPLKYTMYITTKPTEIPDTYLKEKPEWFKEGDYEEYRKGAFGCMNSHLQIIFMARAKGYKRILILEDDMIFRKDENLKNTMDIIDEQLKFIPYEMDLLYLSGRSEIENIKKKTENIYDTKGTLTTGAYMLNEKAMDYILEKSQGYNQEIDVFYKDVVQPNLKCGLVLPLVCIQREDYSDIRNIHVNYFN